MRAQSPNENYTATAAEMILSGVTETAEGAAMVSALRGTKMDELWPAVPIELRNRASFDRAEARASLQSDAGRRLFDKLLAEALPKVRWRAKRRKVAIIIAHCIAMRADEMAIEEALAK